MPDSVRSQVHPILLALGARVRALRVAAGLDQTALAAAAGFSQGYLSRVERGRENLSVISLARLCAVLGTGVGELMADIEASTEGIPSAEASAGAHGADDAAAATAAGNAPARMVRARAVRVKGNGDDAGRGHDGSPPKDDPGTG